MAKYPVNVLKAIFISPKFIDYCDLTNKNDTLKSPADVLSADLKRIRKKFGENKFIRYTGLLNLMRKNIRQAHIFAGDAEMDEVADSLWSGSMKNYVHNREFIKDLRVQGNGWWSFVMTGWDAYKHESIKDVLRKNHTPILVLHGKYDIIPEKTAEEYGSVFPNARLVNIPKCGHLIGLEQPEVLARETELFLAQPLDSTTHEGNNGLK
jgi:pimeloyl-ACP methyl ester carboxylesterase